MIKIESEKKKCGDWIPLNRLTGELLEKLKDIFCAKYDFCFEQSQS